MLQNIIRNPMLVGDAFGKLSLSLSLSLSFSLSLSLKVD